MLNIFLQIDTSSCPDATFYEVSSKFISVAAILFTFGLSLLVLWKDNKLDKLSSAIPAHVPKIAKTKSRFSFWSKTAACITLSCALFSIYANQQISNAETCKSEALKTYSANLQITGNSLLNRLSGSDLPPIFYVDPLPQNGKYRVRINSHDTLSSYNLAIVITDYYGELPLITEETSNSIVIPESEYRQHSVEHFVPVLKAQAKKWLDHRIDFSINRGLIEVMIETNSGQKYVEQIFWKHIGATLGSSYRMLKWTNGGYIEYDFPNKEVNALLKTGNRETFDKMFKYSITKYDVASISIKDAQKMIRESADTTEHDTLIMLRTR